MGTRPPRLRNANLCKLLFSKDNHLTSDSTSERPVVDFSLAEDLLVERLAFADDDIAVQGQRSDKEEGGKPCEVNNSADGVFDKRAA